MTGYGRLFIGTADVLRIAKAAGPWPTYPLVSCLIFQLAVLSAWGQQTLTASDAHAPYKQPGLPIEQRVEDLLGRMTLQEKCGN